MSTREPIIARQAVTFGTALGGLILELPSTIEKLDVVLGTGDAYLQFRSVARGDWAPDPGILLEVDRFYSIPGLLRVFGPEGADAVRFLPHSLPTSELVFLVAWLLIDGELEPTIATGLAAPSAGGGGVVLQGARDGTAQAWHVDDNGASLTVDDGGGSITVDGFPAVQPVNDNGGLLSVDDGAGSLTVDAPVGTPVFVRLSDGLGNLIGQKLMAASLPVVLASDHSLIKAREDAAAMAWVSAKNAAPAIGAVQADTGALAAGNYDFDIELLVSEPAVAGHGLVVEHRNAANGATLQNLGGCSAPGQVEIHLRRYAIALNERIRVIAGTVAGVAGSMYVSAIGSRIS